MKTYNEYYKFLPGDATEQIESLEELEYAAQRHGGAVFFCTYLLLSHRSLESICIRNAGGFGLLIPIDIANQYLEKFAPQLRR
jgi:hypothetical protein